MSKLIPVGFYRELTDDPDEQQTLPRITEALSESPQADEDRIVAYLRGGICLGAKGGYVKDFFDPSSSEPLVPHLYTDGKYLWRLDIAHYVAKYHLRLPSAFVSHMSSMNWKPPTKDQVDVDSLDI
jgi:hypothetical protein